MAKLLSGRSSHAPDGALVGTSDPRGEAPPRGRADYLQAAFESAPDGLLVLDDDRYCLDLNRAACELLGVARAGLVGQRVDTFAPIGWRETVIGGWPAFLRSRHAEGEFETVAPDESRALVEFHAQAGVGTGYHVFVLRDITPSRSTQAARDNLSALLDWSNDAIYMCAHDGVLLSWNRGAEKLYGYTRAEAIGQSITMLLPAAERASRQESWERAWSGGPVEPFETVRITKDGRSVFVAVAVTTITDEFGMATGVGEIARDITEQKYAQAALSAAQAKAVRSSELQTQFIASMNHELRVPLSGVIGISRLLEDTNLDPQQREYVEGLRVSGEVLASAIEAVLDFSKLETSRLELSDEAYDLRALVEDVCSIVSLGASSTEVEVLSYVEPDVPAALHGDEQRVRQVLMTLVGNAVKVTRAGEVFVSARVSAQGDAPHILVEVQSSANGGDPEQHQWAFEAFAPANGSASRQPDATGFGFTIAKRLVALMGGEVRVDSTAGKNDTFSFTLPLRGEVADSAPAPQANLEGVHVLVVCANPSAQQLMVRQLQDYRARVGTSGDRDEALTALRWAAHANDPFTVALIDHSDNETSELDAAALTHTILTDDSLRGTRIAVLFAPRDASALTTVQADALIRKPLGQTRLYRELTLVSELPPRGPAGATADPEQPTPRGGSGRVLITEDNPVNQLVAVHLLEQRGFVVDTANDGREAIVMHARNVYDAIFMDCQLPEINGYEATREIRRREGTKRHTPIIAMTASTLPSDRERCIEAGMDYHIGKPVRPTALDHVMARAIASRPA